LNDYAPDQRAAKRPNEFEPVIVAAVLRESGVKGILRALAHAPTNLPDRQLISTYRWKRRGVRPFAIERYSGDDARNAAIVWSLNQPKPDSRLRQN
jgi:hypothetical protein